MRLHFSITAILIGSVAAAQINYGREDCGPLFDKWIVQLERVKAAKQDSVAGQPMLEFNKWMKEAKKDMAEGKYKILRRTAVTDTRPLFSALDIIQTGKTSGGEKLNAKDFFEYYEAVSENERNLYKTLSWVFNAYEYEKDLEMARYTDMHFSQFLNIQVKDWEAK